jgi:hypothetical protein
MWVGGGGVSIHGKDGATFTQTLLLCNATLFTILNYVSRALVLERNPNQRYWGN